MASIDFLTATDLPLSARSVGAFIERETPRRHPECWLKNETIAQALGLCVRTVRDALRALEAAGLVGLITDYSKRARRRIELLWRSSTRNPSDAQLAANVEHQSRRMGSFTPAEAIKEPEGKDKTKTDDDARPGPVAPPEPAAPVASSSSSGERELRQGGQGQGPDRSATVEEIAAVKALAVEVLGPGNEARTLGQAKRVGSLDWVRRALLTVKDRKARGAVRIGPFAVLMGVLNNWLAEGGPPPEASAVAAEPMEDRIRRMLSEADRLGPWGDGT